MSRLLAGSLAQLLDQLGPRYRPATGDWAIIQLMPRASLLAVALLLTPALACDKQTPASEAPGEDAVDGLTRELLDALAHGDHQRARSLATAALAPELDERTVANIGHTLEWLGPITSLVHRDDTPISGGIERSYRVGFGNGELTLRVTVVDNEIEGFEFDRGQWAAISERAAKDGAAGLRVERFEFVGADGKPLTGPLDPTAIHYHIALAGLDAQLREHHVVIGKLVFDGDGHIAYQQRSDDDIRFPQAETGSDEGTVTGTVAVVKPGSYELHLTITDRIGSHSLVHRVPFSIE